jgi:hypothetical protein
LSIAPEVSLAFHIVDASLLSCNYWPSTDCIMARLTQVDSSTGGGAVAAKHQSG